MRMKKMLILALIGLFYIGISALVPPQQVVVDNDVGYSLIMDQNTSVVTILPVQSPVIAGESSYLLARGVSVPDKGLISSDIIVYNDPESFTCNRYYAIEKFDLKLLTLTGFENQLDKYPFASDLGLRKS
jgi:hypothetical protein